MSPSTLFPRPPCDKSRALGRRDPTQSAHEETDDEASKDKRFRIAGPVVTRSTTYKGYPDMSPTSPQVASQSATL